MGAWPGAGPGTVEVGAGGGVYRWRGRGGGRGEGGEGRVPAGAGAGLDGLRCLPPAPARCSPVLAPPREQGPAVVAKAGLRPAIPPPSPRTPTCSSPPPGAPCPALQNPSVRLHPSACPPSRPTTRCTTTCMFSGAWSAHLSAGDGRGLWMSQVFLPRHPFLYPS